MASLAIHLAETERIPHNFAGLFQLQSRSAGSPCLSEHVVVVDRVMVANVAQLDVIGIEKFEDDPVGAIDSKAPNLVLLRV